MTQREDDWARIVTGWIEDAEREMDEAYRASDGPAYTAAARRRDEMRSTLRVIDPTYPMRRMLADSTAAMRRFNAALASVKATMSLSEDAARALAEKIRESTS